MKIVVSAMRPILICLVASGFVAWMGPVAAEPPADGLEVASTDVVEKASVGLELAKEARALAKRDQVEAALAKAKQALPLMRAEFGSRHAYIGFLLDDLSTLNRQLGRLDEADAYGVQAVPIIAATRGIESVDHAIVANNRATILSDLGRFGEAVPLYERAHASFLAKFGPAHDQTARTASNLGIAYNEMGELRKAKKYFDQALVAAQALHGASSLPFAHALLDRAGLDLKLEAVTNARAAAEQARLIMAGDDPTDPLGLAKAEVMLARADIQESHLSAARVRLMQAIDLLKREDLADSEVSASVYYNLGFLQLLQGQSVEAETTFRRVLELYRRGVGGSHPAVARTLHSLAILYGNLSLADKAEELYRRAIGVFDQSFGPNDPSLAATRLELGLFLSEVRRPKEAIEEAQAALAIYNQIEDIWAIKRAYATSVLGFALRAAGRREEAAESFNRALALMEEVRGSDSADLPPGLVELALIRIEQDRAQEAESLARRAVMIREQDEARTPSGVAKAKSVLARAIAAEGRSAEALDLSAQATKIMRDRINIDTRQTALALDEIRGEREVFERHLAIGFSRLATASYDGLKADLFEVAQLPHLTSTAAAVSRMSARFAKGDDELGKLVWQHEQTVDRWAAVQARLRDVLASDLAMERASKLRAELTQLEAEIDRLDNQLSPDFKTLVRPRPVPLNELRDSDLLAEGEAVLVQVTSDDGTYLAFANRLEARFVGTDLTADELSDRVASLRRGLATGPGTQWPNLAPFDVDAAHRLYQAVFAPFEDELATVTTLFFVPDRAMQNITPAVLLRRPAPLPKEEYGRFSDNRLGSLKPFQDLDFLGLSLPVSILPSLDALIALRTNGLGAGNEPFVGFAPFAHEHEIDRPSLGAAPESGDGAVDPASLPPLPGTYEELLSLAGSLGADESAIVLDDAATEAAVRTRAQENVQVIGFATHGLLAGELGVIGEPALVMHRPKLASGADDGLMLASEIAQLKLAADWVILSACNTAAAEGRSGAEGLSGLARAFFYAGSRSLLVSHWWVDSMSAAFLTKHTLQQWRGNGDGSSPSKAEALRQAMKILARQYLNRAHPFFWAPFTVVGG